MPIIFRRNGSLIEITETEKEPLKVRIHHTRERRTLYGARRPDNNRRTRLLCLRRVSAAIEEFGAPLLVTLTFAGDASDAAHANDSLRSFQVRLRNKYPTAESLFVPELSPKGRIHFHGLLFNVPLSLGDSVQGRRIVSHGEERDQRTLAKLWGEGYVDAKQTDGSPKLAGYITKYITKGSGHVIFNAMRLLRISRGFPKDIVVRGGLAELAALRMANEKLHSEWSKDTPWLGKITKKIYFRDKS